MEPDAPERHAEIVLTTGWCWTRSLEGARAPFVDLARSAPALDLIAKCCAKDSARKIVKPFQSDCYPSS